jgi:hypothetical protein
MKNQIRRYASLILGGERTGSNKPDDSQQYLNDLVPMPEAALLAYISAFGIDNTITRIHRNDMAETLCQLLAVYAVADDGKTVRRVAPEELQGGIFYDGGAIVRFRDDRDAITGLAVMREALRAAVAALKDTKKPTGFNRAA